VSALVQIVKPAGARFLVMPSLSSTGFLHAFGTRDTGRSNRAAHQMIKRAFPGVREIATVTQRHGVNSVRVPGRDKTDSLRRTHADIILTSSPGIAAAVRTADCAPVLIMDPCKKAAAAVHAGWRGTALGVTGAAVRAMRKEFGSKPENLLAGIGPCIMPCHFQVDRPVIEAVRKTLHQKADEVLLPDIKDRARMDLSRANRIALEQEGVRPEKIIEARVCTYCRAEMFFSYRREGKGVSSLYSFITVDAP